MDDEERDEIVSQLKNLQGHIDLLMAQQTVDRVRFSVLEDTIGQLLQTIGASFEGNRPLKDVIETGTRQRLKELLRTLADDQPATASLIENILNASSGEPPPESKTD